MPRSHVPLPPKAQRALELWMFAHLAELDAVLSPWGLPASLLTTPQFTFTVDEPDEPAPVKPSPRKPRAKAK